jgi:hybrid cluster-associated redox disulfide protein
MEKVQITKDMIVSDILRVDIGIGRFLMEAGMNCLHCSGASMKNLAIACEGHGVDCDELVEKINDYLKNKPESE